MNAEEKRKFLELKLDLEMTQITVDQLKTRLLSAETALEERDQKIMERDQKIMERDQKIMELNKQLENSETSKKKRSAQNAVDAIEYISRNGRPIGGEQTYNMVHLLQVEDELKKVFMVREATDWEEQCAMAACDAIHYLAYNEVNENMNVLYNRIHLQNIVQDLKDEFIKEKK